MERRLISRDRLGEMLMGTYTVYRETLSKPILEIWWKLLQGKSQEDVERSFGIYLNSHTRLPVPADIIGLIEGTDEEKAIKALNMVEEAMEKYGAWKSVVFSDPLIHVVIGQTGGWIKVCRLTEKDYVWWAKDFRERYRILLRHPDENREIPERLPGYADLENRRNGLPESKPVMIGFGVQKESIPVEGRQEKAISGSARRIP